MELANLQSDMMDQDQGNDGVEYSETKVCALSSLPPPHLALFLPCPLFSPLLFNALPLEAGKLSI